MGYAVGYVASIGQRHGGRWVGYGVPAECDIPECHEEIDRGFGYRCEDHNFYDSETDDLEEIEGCHLFFCLPHKYDTLLHRGVVGKDDSPEWLWWLLTAPSWGLWRLEHPEKVREYQQAIKDADYRPTKGNLEDLMWDMEECGIMTTEEGQDI